LIDFHNILPVDSERNLLLSGMHITVIMSLHYLVKYNIRKRTISTDGNKVEWYIFKYSSKMLNISYNKY